MPKLISDAKSFTNFAILGIVMFVFFFLSMHVGATAPTITGNATADFATLPGVNAYDDPIGDIGVPALIGTNASTGWNISKTYVWYDVTTDKLYVGVQCTQICGDADGDGNPGSAGPALTSIPGSDTDWGPGETGAFIINTNTVVNTNFNVIVGKRTNLNGISNWGIYYFNKPNELNGGVDSNWLLPDISDPARPAFIATSSVLAATHDLELVINDFSTLHGIDLSNMKIGVFMGSSTDDGIGEDTLAGQGTPFSIQKLTVKKVVINDDGGTLTSNDFPLAVSSLGTVVNGVPNSALTTENYTVSETQQTGYSQTNLKCVDDKTNLPVSHPVKLDPGQNVTCTITNDDIAPKLTIVKKVINNNGGAKVVADFPLKVDNGIGSVTSGAQNKVKAAVTYTASETQLPGYLMTGIECSDDVSHLPLSHPITLKLDQSATCTITNDDIAPKLTVVKQVTNDNGGTKSASDFPLFVDSGTVLTGIQNTTTANTPHNVSETLLPGYTQVSIQCIDDISHASIPNPVTLTSGQNATCTIINDDIAPHLTVIKKVINDQGGTKVVSDFPLFVDGNSVTSGVQNTSVAVTPHTVSETAVAGYTQVSLVCNDDKSNLSVTHPVVLSLDQSVTCTITNDDDLITPHLRVIKKVINDNGGLKTVSDFPLFVDGNPVTSGTKNSSTVTVPHTVSETTQSGYTQVSMVCVDDKTNLVVAHPVVLVSAQDVTCTITNDDIAPHITVIKKVINNDGGTKTTSDFPLFVDGVSVTSGIQNVSVANIPHTVSETIQAGYTQTSLVCVDDKVHVNVPHPVVLLPDQSVTCTLTNEDDTIPPHLTVIKKVINDNGGTKTISDFPLFVDNAPVTSGVKNTSTVNVPHTVTETSQSEYSQSSIICLDDNTHLPVAHPVVLISNQDVTCTITNDDLPIPHITVIKKVINDNGGSKLPNDFLPSIDGSYVPSGTKWIKANGIHVVSETLLPGYIQISLICIDDLTHLVVPNPINLAPDSKKGQDVTCTITNDDIAPQLTVVKKVINNDGGTKVVADFPLFVDGNAVVSGVQNTSVAVTPHTGTETQQAGYTQTSLVCLDDATSAPVVHPVKLSLAQKVTCTITNDDDKPVCVKDDESYKDARNCKPTAPTCLKPGIIVKKVVINDNGGKKMVSDFKLSVDNTTVISGVDNTFSLGTPHTVSEVNLDGYKQTSITCIDLQTKLTVPNPVVLAANQVVKCTIINDDISPKITVVKKVINDNGGKKMPGDFTLLLNGKTVKTGISSWVKANTTYTVSENSISGYKQTSLVCIDDKTGGKISNPMNLKLGQAVTCTIINDDIASKPVCNTRNGGSW